MPLFDGRILRAPFKVSGHFYGRPMIDKRRRFFSYAHHGNIGSHAMGIAITARAIIDRRAINETPQFIDVGARLDGINTESKIASCAIARNKTCLSSCRYLAGVSASAFAGAMMSPCKPGNGDIQYTIAAKLLLILAAAKRADK